MFDQFANGPLEAYATRIRGVTDRPRVQVSVQSPFFSLFFFFCYGWSAFTDFLLLACYHDCTLMIYSEGRMGIYWWVRLRWEM